VHRAALGEEGGEHQERRELGLKLRTSLPA
jgi:hypothetical protein